MSGRSIQKSFPFTPVYSTWEEWNGNFIQWYGEEPIPMEDELNWKITANSINQLSIFSVYPLPDPESFANWQDWASEVTEMINGPAY